MRSGLTFRVKHPSYGSQRKTPVLRADTKYGLLNHLKYASQEALDSEATDMQNTMSHRSQKQQRSSSSEDLFDVCTSVPPGYLTQWDMQAPETVDRKLENWSPTMIDREQLKVSAIVATFV